MSICFQAPETCEIIPRPYQEEALDALDHHIRTKDTNPCVVIPTGGGKSILMAWAIQQWKKDYPPFRCCILAHRKELVEQNMQELIAIWPGIDVGCYAAGLRKRDQENSIIYASIDSVYNKWGEFPKFDVVIIDEAHRIPPSGEGKYRKFINGCLKVNKNLRVIGFTATPFRMNCGPICHRDHILNEICYEANIVDLINDGYLCKLRSKVEDMEIDMSEVKKNSGGDYVVKSLAETVNTDKIVQHAIQSAMQIMNSENRKSAVFFCVDVKHCKDVAVELRKYGMNVPAITGKTPIAERDRVAEAFKNGQIRAIANVNVFTEGFNAKRVDCIVLLRPTLSPGLYMQMVGRGLRLHESKKDCIVLDFANCINTHGPIDCVDAGEVSIITCENCGDVFSRVIKICPHCGWEIPKQEIERYEAEIKEKRIHETKASNRSILSGEPEVFSVDSVSVHRHRKRGKPDSIRVQYRSGLNVFREWICLDHGGPAEDKARKWWRLRFGEEEAKKITVNDALSDMFITDKIKDKTEKIVVRQRGKYTEIIGYRFRIATKNYYQKEKGE